MGVVAWGEVVRMVNGLTGPSSRLSLAEAVSKSMSIPLGESGSKSSAGVVGVMVSCAGIG